MSKIPSNTIFKFSTTKHESVLIHMYAMNLCLGRSQFFWIYSQPNRKNRQFLGLCQSVSNTNCQQFFPREITTIYLMLCNVIHKTITSYGRGELFRITQVVFNYEAIPSLKYVKRPDIVMHAMGIVNVIVHDREYDQ